MPFPHQTKLVTAQPLAA